MIYIAICDDDFKTTECIERLIINHPVYRSENIEVSIFYSGESFTKAIQPGCPFDLVFMDIEMKGISGITAGHVLRGDCDNDRVRLIYVSSHEEYHVQLFDVQPSGFIKKPIHNESFEKKLFSMIQQIKVKRQQNQPKLLPVHQCGTKILIPIRNIMYLASDRRKIILQTTEDQTEYYSTLSIEEEKLPSKQFVRIHQSYLVNFDYIKQIQGKRIVLTSGEELPISDEQSIVVKKSYLQFRGSLLE
ncbi:LytTR family DNA-binding domain-containing protein [Paenibacillus sp. FSL F4-0125]|uniref:LytR/AlgR family response regulator transcription factor n=1 Tax=Paenibacillus sp. FSL F4-0125 TaxID=2954730 RepID=UPI0030FA1570